MPDEELDEFTKQKPFLSDNAYNYLKNILTIVVPAFGTLYLALDGIWDLPKENEVVATCLAVATFLGIVLKVSSNRYTSTVDGVVTVTEQPDGTRNTLLNLQKSPEEFEKMDLVRFKVDKQSPIPPGV